MDTFTVKVTRVMYPVGQPAEIRDRGNILSSKQHLSDVIRHQMGGERIAYFDAEKHGDKWVLTKILENQKW